MGFFGVGLAIHLQGQEARLVGLGTCKPRVIGCAVVHGWVLSMGMRVFDSHVDPVVPLVRSGGMVGRPCPPCPWSLSNVGSDRAWTIVPSDAWREETPCGVVVGVGWMHGASPSVAFPFPRSV